jgi:hypothetical protein
MESRLTLDISAQPDDFTCGPTCLHAVYRYFDDTITLDEVIRTIDYVEGGGTLDVHLACHALKRGYEARIYTYNLQIFDPTWFEPNAPPLAQRLLAQKQHKDAPKLAVATDGYVEFLSLGGEIRFKDLSRGLIRKYLNRGVPVLTGLSATYLHRSMRERGDEMDADDLRGEPQGHFVVLSGYDHDTRQVLVADPMEDNPHSSSHQYLVDVDRVICAILLGILTYDANLLIIEPRGKRGHGRHADPDRS